MRHNLFLVALLYTSNISAQGTRGALNIYFNTLAHQEYMNGNILLARNGRIIYQRFMGQADYASATPNDQNTRYNLASISKVFTSTAILQLKEKGLLQLDDTLDRYLPDFPYKGITIRHLLTHTSGLPDLELYEPLVKQYPDTVVTNNIIIPTLIREKRPLSFLPGDKYSYSNTNFELLALIVEKITALPFPAYLEQHIFQPAGMLLTSCVQTDNGAPAPGMATPHVRAFYFDTTYTAAADVKRYRYTTYNNSAAVGASNIVTTTSDLFLFDKALFSGRLLSKASMEAAFTPLVLNNGDTLWEQHMDTMQGEGKGSYGLGWEIFIQPGMGKSVGHGGFKFGLATFYFHNLDKQQTIIAFDNTAAPAFGHAVTSAFRIMNAITPAPLLIKRSLVRVYGQTMVIDGAAHAIRSLNMLKDDTVHYYFNEREMNQLGYEFLYFSSFPAHEQMAVETFKINVSLFPESYNTYDSYAEALAVTGKKAEAILMYKKSIAMNPNNHDGARALQRLLSQ